MPAKRIFGRRRLMLSAVIGFLVLAGALAVTRGRDQPHVVAAFVGYTDSLKPDRAEFAITNLSKVQVELLSYRKVADSAPLSVAANAIGPGDSCVVWLDFAKPIEFNTQVELVFRAPDSLLEGVRELAHGILRDMGVKWRGLKPGSQPTVFSVTASLPPREQE
jgi:hypothetical protein